MALSGETRGKVRVEGIPAALHIVRSIPKGIVAPTIEDTLDEVTALGIGLMKLHIFNSIRTEKSTGGLEASVEGEWQKTQGSATELEGRYEMEIGSPLPYAKYASREIGLSTINKNVLILSGRWRWVGIRAPIPRHPFLEQTLIDLDKALPALLYGNFTSYIGHIQREADATQLFSWLESPS